jgi:hypothetical protein
MENTKQNNTMVLPDFPACTGELSNEEADEKETTMNPKGKENMKDPIKKKSKKKKSKKKKSKKNKEKKKKEKKKKKKTSPDARTHDVAEKDEMNMGNGYASIEKMIKSASIDDDSQGERPKRVQKKIIERVKAPESSTTMRKLDTHAIIAPKTLSTSPVLIVSCLWLFKFLMLIVLLFLLFVLINYLICVYSFSFCSLINS